LIGTISLPGRRNASLIGTIIIPEEPEPEEIEEEEIIERAPRPPRVRNPYIEYYFGAALMPYMPLYGELFWLADEDTIRFRTAFRFAFTSSRLGFLKWGLEMAASLFTLTTGSSNTLSVTGDICLLLQRPIPDINAAFSFRFGTGTVLGSNTIQELNTQQTTHIFTGISFLWLPINRLYFETGVDLLFWHTNQIVDQPEFASCFRPFIGLGFKF
jgi:hypothetical protein